MAGRDPTDAHRASTPLELLFDLCFVVAVASAASALHHDLVEGLIWHGLVNYLVIFFAIWWPWMNFTWFASAYDNDDVPYRLITMVQIAGALTMAAGIPRARASNQYTEPTQQFFCGIWTSTAGKWRVRYTEHEFCVIIEGRVRVESVTGEKHDLRAGDAFVVPAGFEGVWEVTEPCKKWYSIFEPS